MQALLFALFSWILTEGFKKILIALGVSVVSSAVFNTILEQYINKAINAANSVDPTYLGLLHISGVDKGISIIMGALVARATLMAYSATITKTK